MNKKNTPLTSAQVDEWVMAMTVAWDPKSPFKGMVDMNEVLGLPLADQHRIFDALPKRIQRIVQKANNR